MIQSDVLDYSTQFVLDLNVAYMLTCWYKKSL